MIALLLLACNGTAKVDDTGSSSSSSSVGCIGTGYASKISEWSLPTGFKQDTFQSLADANSSDGVNWGLLDLDGDQATDLIQTAADGAAAIGKSKWLMYGNSGSGFGPKASDWTLPEGFDDGTFEYLADTNYSDGVNWGLVDLTGDGAVDLVQTYGSLPAVGTTKWRVFENDRSGFASKATDWTLPDGYSSGTFKYLGDASNGDGLSWALMDLNGDRKVDLVGTATDDDPKVGTTRWIVYENNGSGFGPDPVEWSLPKGFEDDTFALVADSSSGDGVTWALLDLTGDGAPEIVLTAFDGEKAVGSSRWAVYANNRTGFENDPTDWALPSGFKDQTFDAVADSDSGDGVRWVLTDLDGSGAPDLVVVDSDAGETIGEAKWLLYGNEGDGFAKSAVDWTLPNGFAKGTFDSFGDAADKLSWSVLSLGQDNVADIVITHNSAVEDVGTSLWQVAEATCE